MNKGFKKKFKNEAYTWKRSFGRYWQLYILLIPVVLNFVIFHYIPMGGIQIAFKNFKISEGIWDSAWVGFEHFKRFFSAYNFWQILGNTLILSVISLAFSFPLSICLALVLNEIQHKKLNSTLQTIFFVPHFVSTVVVVGMLQAFLSPETGIVNILLMKLGVIQEGIYFTRLEEWFRPMYIISGLWQNMGWNAAIYLSALTAIDPELYDAAAVDGANKWKQLLHITLPCIWPTIVIQLILKVGHIMSVGYEKVLLMQTSTNLGVSQIISTFVYEKGISSQQYDYATAIGLFNSVINLIVLLVVNHIAKKRSDVSLF
ncbi:MAG: sugar ABC transporter permease [Tyzzerella sp.]|nr:sugar ABC transporter permease [Tyzzerella sp.]